MPASGAFYGPAHWKVPVDRAVAGSRACPVSPALAPAVRGSAPAVRGSAPAVRGSASALPVLPRARHRRWLRLRRSGLRRSGLGAGCDAAACESSAAHGASPAGGGASTKSDPSTDEGGPVGAGGSASGSEDVTTFSGSPAMDTATTVVHTPPTRAAHGEPTDADRPRTEATLATEQVGDRPLQR